MSNPFTSLKDYVDKPKRNTFDLSFQNNLTMEFGKLYPVFCKEVVPGDSFRIKPTFGLRFMPLVFPVQTRMQANLHFFYVRNRNLWKNWPDFIGRTKSDLVTPFLSPRVAKKVCKTRGLGDYFGLPTTLVGDYGSVHEDTAPSINWTVETRGTLAYNYMASPPNSAAPFYGLGMPLSYIEENTKYWTENGSTADETARFRGVLSSSILVNDIAVSEINNRLRRVLACRFTGAWPGGATGSFGVRFFIKDPASGNAWRCCAAYTAVGISVNGLTTAWPDAKNFYYSATDHTMMFDLGLNDNGSPGGRYTIAAYLGVDGNAGTYDTLLSAIRDYTGQSNPEIRLMFGECSSDASYEFSFSDRSVSDQTPASFFSVASMRVSMTNTGVLDLSDAGDSLNPYASGDVKVSALPFRAYESIYNAFYRNQFNDPFVLNGVKEYNKFITTDADGEDDTDYDILYRNWEMDFLTSAKQSPVDGDITPLVGVSSTGRFTFQNEDGTTYTVTPILGEDGHTLTGIDSVEGEPENNSGIRRLMDMASIGISINDFRNVNALQRWLEANLRRGYRYKDQLMTHFGVDAKFDVLDMPEFIGGMSEPVIVNQINQSVDQTGSADGLGKFSEVLGSYAGQASILSQSRHDIDKYCDEHGFIIGILSISPVPNYSQLLPKMFLKNNVLDYYFPEFGHIGNQPIPYSEVCPLQSFAAGDPLTDVFGYQRAWYDYLASVDEVHGDFRTTLEGFLINRVFPNRPVLGKQFIQVDPKDNLSDPFSVRDDSFSDRILGEVYFEVTAQRPIPKYGIPRLE